MDPLPERCEHDGVVVRRWTPADAEALDAIVRDDTEHLRPYMAWIGEEPMTVERRRELLRSWEREWLDGGDLVCGIFVDGEPVGGTGLHRRLGPHGLEIGYWVSHRHEGRGIVRRSSHALTSLAFTVPEIEVVEIHHDLTNVRSRRIPEQLGFHHVGQSTLDRALAPAECGIDVIWRMTRDEWLAR